MTKKKSIWAFVLAICLIVPAMFMMTACGHAHTFSKDWTKDATHHWHAATCEHTDEKGSYAEHTFGEWTVTTEAGYGTTGSRERVCSVCEYKATETISAIDAKENTIAVNEINFTYNGNSQAIDTLITASNKTGMVVEYEGRSYTTYAKSTTAPTNAGLYKYTITIPATDEWEAVTKSGDFQIKRQMITELEKKHTKVYNGNNVIDVRLDQTKYKGLSAQIYFAEGDVNVGVKTITRILVNGIGKDNYDVDITKVSAEITARKLNNFDLKVTSTDVPDGSTGTKIISFTIDSNVVARDKGKVIVKVTFDAGLFLSENSTQNTPFNLVTIYEDSSSEAKIEFKTDGDTAYQNYEFDITNLGTISLQK